MSPFLTVLIAVVLLAAVAAVAFGLASAWQHVLADTQPVPLYGMLKHQGLSLGEAGEALGVQRLAYAVRRCVNCTYGAQCQQRVAAGEPAPSYCPNAGLFAGLGQPRA